MPKPHTYLYTLLACILLFASCANIMSPTGGPIDKTAPILKQQNVKDSTLNFKGGKIYFDFDEFVKVNDIQHQFIITPFVKTMPKITAHKKRVTIHLHDSLLASNTTYQFFLGQAIQDLHESNPYSNLSFTFSTGSYFDSLSLKGYCTDAATGLADTASYILLYLASDGDSAFSKSKPMYAQKTDNGFFHFEHLPQKDFLIFALHDNNNNFYYDGNGEQIAYYDQIVNPIDSSLFVKLYSFIEIDSRDSLVKKKSLKSNKAAINPLFTYTVQVDTLNQSKRTYDISKPLSISFSSIVKDFDKTKIRLFQGEVYDAAAQIELDSTLQKINIQTEWAEDAIYHLKLVKGFAMDSSDRQSAAAEFTFHTKSQSDYGYISVICDQNETDLIELLNHGKVIAQKRAQDTLIKFNLLLPDNYQIRILHDVNKNGIWDTGNWRGEKRQAELVDIIPHEITIKANWENNVDIRNSKKEKKLLSK